MKSLVSILVIINSSLFVYSQQYQSSKAVIDQGNFYTVVAKERSIILEIRAMDAPLEMVKYKLIPVRRMEDGRDIVWDVKDGFLYSINMMEQANMEIGETLKKFKISDLKDDVDYQLTIADYMANSYLVNKPFTDIYAHDVVRIKFKFDLSVSDRLYIYASNGEAISALYSTGEAGDWDMVEVSKNDFDHFIAIDHLYYDDQLIMKGIDCGDCKQSKVLRDQKNYPLIIVNKDNNSTLCCSKNFTNEDFAKQNTRLFILKNSTKNEFK